MKRDRTELEMSSIVWQSPSNPPERHDYIFRNGRRHVRPYYFEFISHVKNRWAGKTIVDLFAEEFKGRQYDYYVSAVKCGRIQVDGEEVPVSYIVKSSQKISHFLHRHEPPVMALDVSVLHQEVDVLTVCKPASVPVLKKHQQSEFLGGFESLFNQGGLYCNRLFYVSEVHPCGQYRKNTVVGILQAEYGLAPLFPVHRLDRLVSGLLIFARSATKANLFRKQIETGMVQKQYVAKVTGVFPEEEQVVNANVNYNARAGKSSVEVGDRFDDKPLEGKTASTKFTRISTNGTHSIVLCEPVTGRTHQIRVHLQYTGHPIANDMLYLSEVVPNRSTQGVGADKAAAVNPRLSTSSPSSDSVEVERSDEDFSIDPMCTNCPNLGPKGYDSLEEGLWLHCAKYSGPGWVYECPYPDWAVV